MAEQSYPSLRTVLDYTDCVRAFRPNARLYLINVIIAGGTFGIFRLLFNFYVLSLGHDEALLGRLIAVSSFAALIASLPMGYLADSLGRKYSLILSGAGISLSVLGMVLWPSVWVFYAMNSLLGAAQSLSAVTMPPFLMENSGEKERTYLFSFASGLDMSSAFFGNWIGGYLPTWIGNWRAADATSAEAYGGSLLAISLFSFLALWPLLSLSAEQHCRAGRLFFAPIDYAKRHPLLLAKLISPILLTAIGAGLIMPFMNLFYRVVHDQPDPVIGSLFAWGALAMGIGLLIAPPLSDRYGKIKVVVVTQALSVPFLVLLGFAPSFYMSAMAYYIRLTLMNMGSPLYQTFVMEQIEPSARATVAGLISIAWSFGWALSPMISGWFQVHYGFGPPYIGTILFYSVSVFLYWKFFR